MSAKHLAFSKAPYTTAWRKVGDGRVLHALRRVRVEMQDSPFTRYIVHMACRSLWWNRGIISDYSEDPSLPKCKRCLARLAMETRQ